MINLMEVVESGKDLFVVITEMSRQDVLKEIQEFKHNKFELDFTEEFLVSKGDDWLKHVLYGAWFWIEFDIAKKKELVTTGC